MRKPHAAIGAAAVILLSIISLFSQSSAAQSNSPLLLRFPTVSKTQIVFNYADDLWIVAIGVARKYPKTCWDAAKDHALQSV